MGSSDYNVSFRPMDSISRHASTGNEFTRNRGGGVFGCLHVATANPDHITPGYDYG
jgi:hypothetical protein